MNRIDFFEACILGDIVSIKNNRDLPVNDQDDVGRTGLMLACWYNRKDVINHLLSMAFEPVHDKEGRGYQYYFDNIGLGLQINENRMSMKKIMIENNIADTVEVVKEKKRDHI